MSRRGVVPAWCRRWLPVVVVLLLCATARPDGYPFSERTQQVYVPHLRLKLAPEQTKEVSATGTLTFDEGQLRLIRRHYPKMMARVDVIAATFNDATENANDVICLWVAADEVAITLGEESAKDDSPPMGPPMNDTFPIDGDLKDSTSRHLRLAPDGALYFRGKEVTLERAFALVDELARLSKPEDRDDPSGWPCLYVTMPPPGAAYDGPGEEPERPTPPQVFEALTIYGKAKAVRVERTW